MGKARLGTSASLLVTSALLVVTRSYVRAPGLTTSKDKRACSENAPKLPSQVDSLDSLGCFLRTLIHVSRTSGAVLL